MDLPVVDVGPPHVGGGDLQLDTGPLTLSTL